MKKVNLILTTLVMLMGVLTTNIMGQTTLPYGYDYYSVDDDFSDWDITLGDGTLNYSKSVFGFSVYSMNPSRYSAEVEFEQSFDLSDVNSINLSFNIKYVANNWDYGYDDDGLIHDNSLKFKVYMSQDNGVTYDSVFISNAFGEFNSGTTPEIGGQFVFDTIFSFDYIQMDYMSSNTLIKIVIIEDSQSVRDNGNSHEQVQVMIMNLDIVPNTVTVGLEENSLEENLNIYSNNKTIYISSITDSNINVDIYNINGQLVKSLELNSNTNNTIDMNDVDNGFYIINVRNGLETFSKKLILK